MGLVGQAQHGNPLRGGNRWYRFAVKPAGYIGVHARTAEVFTNAVHNQDIHIRNADAGHVALCPFQQSRLSIRKLPGRDSHDIHGVVIGVLNKADSKEYRKAPQQEAADIFHIFGHVIQTQPVTALCSPLLAKTDGQHVQ